MHGQRNDKYTEMHGQRNDKYTEMHGQQNNKYTEMHGQQNDKYTEIHGQQNDKYTEIHGQQNYKYTEMHGQQNDKYTEMHGQKNDKCTEMHGHQNDKYTEMHGQQNVKICYSIVVHTDGTFQYNFVTRAQLDGIIHIQANNAGTKTRNITVHPFAFSTFISNTLFLELSTVLIYCRCLTYGFNRLCVYSPSHKWWECVSSMSTLIGLATFIHELDIVCKLSIRTPSLLRMCWCSLCSELISCPASKNTTWCN